MKAVVQRVKNASVSVDGQVHGKIPAGLVVYLGVAQGDTQADAAYLGEKIGNLRIFADDDGKMNRSVKDAGGGILAVSQFTLLADTRKGRRPFYGDAAEPAMAKALYTCFMDKIREQGLRCESGVFQAHMEVTYTNDGPVTILLDSKDRSLPGV
ncbi:MAG: D-tyrosyl-tRNA(Tyr) deacylase [Treponema sp.]|jgi:D-tyrosyl-tRNA(Tyr) deacylase|nr:D-tyrosyl-tRNA(Tyr) deacylase [Treponema sp.]